jgi:hypothetical protein
LNLGLPIRQQHSGCQHRIDRLSHFVPKLEKKSSFYGMLALHGAPAQARRAL